MKDHIDVSEWHTKIKTSLSKWHFHGWLEKLAKGKYRRIDLPDWSDREMEEFERANKDYSTRDTTDDFDETEIDDHPFG